MMDCSDMKHINLEHWEEGRDGECTVDGVTMAVGAHRVVNKQVCTCTREGPICDQ